MGNKIALNAVAVVISIGRLHFPEVFVEHFRLSIARHGVAILARTVFLESVGRYNKIFFEQPPTKFAQFTERVPMVKGRLDIKASTATGYAWLIWEKTGPQIPRLMCWVPPCRKALEREGDYSTKNVRRTALSRSLAR